MRQVLIGVVLAALLLPSVAQAAPPTPERRAARTAEQRAIDLLNKASQRTRALHPQCRLSLRRTPPRITDAPVDPAITSVLAIFRRPATPHELSLAYDVKRVFMPGAVEAYSSGVRVVTSATGVRFTIRALGRVERFGLAPAVQRRCNAWTRARLGGSSRVARRARQILDGMKVPDSPAAAPGLVLSVHGGATGGQLDPKRFAEMGMWLGSVPAPGQKGGVTRLYGLVPDGVDRIVFEARGLSRTARVWDNVVSTELPYRPRTGFLPRMTWLGPDGTAIKVVRPPA